MISLLFSVDAGAGLALLFLKHRARKNGFAYTFASKKRQYSLKSTIKEQKMPFYGGCCLE